jgi:hypothetical protein
MVPGPYRGFKLCGGGPLQLVVAPIAAIIMWLDALGQRFCLLVCVGQAVPRTVSVAVRAIGRLNARVHGHIADRVGAANAERRRLRRSVAIWCG